MLDAMPGISVERLNSCASPRRLQEVKQFASLDPQQRREQRRFMVSEPLRDAFHRASRTLRVEALQS